MTDTPAHRSTKKMVMYDSPEAAQVKEVSGWVSASGRFWGNDEHMARWEECTHLTCQCGEEVIEKSRLRCSKCQTALEHQERLKLPLVEWDGESPLAINRTDQYFFSGESVYEYAEDNDIKVSDLDLVVCVPNRVRELDGYDHCCDELPEDGDLPAELEAAVREFNKVVRGLAPLSWSHGNKRVIFPEQDNG